MSSAWTLLAAARGEQDPQMSRWLQRRLQLQLLAGVGSVVLLLIGGAPLYRALGPRTLTWLLVLAAATAYYDFWREQLGRKLNEPRRSALVAATALYAVVAGAMVALPFDFVSHLWLRNSSPGVLQWLMIAVLWIVASFVGAGMGGEFGPCLAVGAAATFLVFWPSDFDGMWRTVLPLLVGSINTPVQPVQLSQFFALGRSARTRSVAFAALPAVFVVTHPIGTPMLVVGLSITAVALSRIHRVQASIRSFRTGAMITFARLVTWTPLVAVTVVGHRVAQVALVDPRIAAAALVLIAMALRQTAEISRVTRIPLSTAIVLATPAAWITDLGLFAFCVAAIAWPDPRLVPVAIAAAAVEAWYEAKRRLFSGQRPTRELIALMAMTPESRALDWALWMRDRVIVPRRPDFGLARALSAEAHRIAAVGSSPADSLIPVPGLPRGADSAEQWLDLEAEALSAVHQTLPHLHWSRREPIRNALAVQIAAHAHRKASLNQLIHRLEEALALWQEADNLWMAADQPLTAKIARLNAASLLFRLGYLEAARERFEQIVAEPGLNTMLRAQALHGMAFSHLYDGDFDAFLEDAKAARTLRLKVADLRDIDRAVSSMVDVRLVFRLPGWLHRRLTQRLLTAYFSATIGPGDHPAPMRRFLRADVRRRETFKAEALALQGNNEAAAQSALKALKQSRKAGQLSYEASTLELLARVTPDDRPDEKFAYIVQAIDARERTREQLLMTDTKIHLGGRHLDRLHEQGLAVLVRSHERPRWRTEAFNLTERARARHLLELISTGTRRSPDDPLVRQEERDFAEYRSATELLDDERQPIALLRSRAAHTTLGQTWQQLEQQGGDLSSYARLRRGTPLDYSQIRDLLASQ